MKEYDVNIKNFQGVFFLENNHMSFNFLIEGKCREMLRIAPEGFYIQGKLLGESVEDSLSVYETFKKFLEIGVLTNASKVFDEHE
jgi:hypothetical protein